MLDLRNLTVRHGRRKRSRTNRTSVAETPRAGPRAGPGAALSGAVDLCRAAGRRRGHDRDGRRAGRQPGKNHARRPDAGPRQRVRHRPHHRAPLRGGGGRAGRLLAAVSAGGPGGDPRPDAGERLAVHLPGAAARFLPPQPAQRPQAHPVLAWRDRAWQGAAEDSGHRRCGRLGGVGRAGRDRFSARCTGRARTRASGQPARAAPSWPSPGRSR